uniref:TRASH domain-containing protein n=1 Tax=Fervidicoccus fontis TaxID=683846 RepID=A0A7J3ZML6_9CREN
MRIAALRRRCVVCGKTFPEGQGIVIEHSRLVLEFHSKRCLARFFRRLFQDAPDISCIEKTIKDILEEFGRVSEKTVKKL